MEFDAHVEQFKNTENLRQLAVARVAASFAGGQPADFLPFKPPRKYLTVEEAEALFDRDERINGKR